MKLDEELLISAYLDGEVSADEQKRAEQLLAGSAEARQLADEMRAVRVRLQGLPRYGLPADFAEQTTRRAEQELAAANTATAADASVAPTGSGKSGPLMDGTSVWKTWRGFAWAAVALAAGMMLLITNRELPPASKQVADAESYVAPTTSTRVQESEGMKADNAAEPQSMNQLSKDAPTGAESHPGPKAELNARSQPNITGFSAPSRGVEHYSGISAGATGARKPEDITYKAAAAQAEGARSAEAKQDSVSAEEAIDLGSDEFVVITLNITPEAAERQEFRQLLAKHNIQIADQKLKASVGGEARSDKSQALDSNLPLASTAGNADGLFVIDASTAQLRATVSDLVAAKKKGVWSVNVAKWMRVDGSTDHGSLDAVGARDEIRAKDDKTIVPPPPAPAVEGAAPPAAVEKHPGDQPPPEQDAVPTDPKPTTLTAPSERTAPAPAAPANRLSRGNAAPHEQDVPIALPDAQSTGKTSPGSGSDRALGATDGTSKASLRRSEGKESPRRRALFVLRVAPEPMPTAASVPTTTQVPMADPVPAAPPVPAAEPGK